MQANIFFPINEYNGIKIYIRDYGKGVFEFIFSRGGELYSRFTEVRPNFGARLMVMIGEPLFTDEEIKNIKARLEREAIAAINLMEAQRKQTHRNFINQKQNG
jgi:hypothetical protein